VSGLSTQFTGMQAMQGASIVGRDVVVPGDKLAIANGAGTGGFELSTAADNVTVEILSSAGIVQDTIQLGAAGSGLHGFTWPSGTTAR
ncbi:hypothetical protein LMP03_14210, partial [Staphylococcus aureus]|uniref:flagellar hook assembly protein FlgD n=1 Tax=Staphylococcus aureus TaxID=1280 RepID=UPI001E42AC93